MNIRWYQIGLKKIMKSIEKYQHSNWFRLHSVEKKKTYAKVQISIWSTKSFAPENSGQLGHPRVRQLGDQRGEPNQAHPVQGPS